VGLAIRSLAVNWQSLKAQPLDWRIAPAWLAASVTTVFAGYAVLIEAWRRVVLSMGQQLGFIPAARIWFVASLGKYIPGKVWAVAGTAMLAQRAGVQPSAAVAAALVLQALSLASGALVVGLTAGSIFSDISPELAPVLGVLLLACVGGVGALASQPLLDRVNRYLPRAVPPLRAIRPGTLILSFGANLVAWIAYGVALLFLAKGVLPDISLGLLQAIGVFTCSYLVGFVALFAPGGLGPRESVFLLVLAGDIGLKPAAGLALASRILLTGTEVLPTVPFLLRQAHSSHPTVRDA
jgi:hypothetical protein